MSLETYKLVGLSYSPDDIRFGHTGSIQYFFERRRNQAILQGSLRLFELQTQYARSQANAPSYTMLVHRDNLLALALALCLRCVQTRDVLYTEMTTHASRYWGEYGNDFWSNVPLYESNPDYTPDVGFTGVAGSLAFLLYQSQDMGAGLYPSQLIQKMLDYLWEQCGTLSNSTPRQKQRDFIESLGGTNIPYKNYQQVLDSLYKTELSSLSESLQDLVIKMRRRMLTPTDWILLKPRWIMGEVTNELLISIRELQQLINTDAEIRATYQVAELPLNVLDTFNNNRNQVLAPAGPPLFYVGLAVEALLNVSRQITQDEELHQLTYQEFLSRSDYQPLRRQWALDIAAAYDAMGVLSIVDTLYEAKGLCYRFFLQSLQLIQGDSPIPKEGYSRLGEIL